MFQHAIYFSTSDIPAPLTLSVCETCRPPYTLIAHFCQTGHHVRQKIDEAQRTKMHGGTHRAYETPIQTEHLGRKVIKTKP